MNERSAFRAFIADNAPAPPLPPGVPPIFPVGEVPVPGLPTTPYQAPSAREAKGNSKEALPSFKSAASIKPDQIKLPSLLIDGILHRGSKLVLAGGSKSFKSWSLIDMALSVAAGLPWWGQPCRQGRVLYINFELIDGFFEQRLTTVARAKEMALPEALQYWNLRGLCYNLDILIDVLRARVMNSGQFDLIIIDPIYKALGDLDENSAGDMSQLMLSIEMLGDAIGSAVVFGAHFSKGNQSAKESMDRISGSGVFARDPDAILTMTRHAEKGSFVVESDLRYLPYLPEFVVSWDFPLMKLDEAKDPHELYQPQQPGAARRPREEAAAFTKEEVLRALPEGGLQVDAWRTTVIQIHGRAGRDFYSFKGELIEEGRVVKDGLRYRPILELRR